MNSSTLDAQTKEYEQDYKNAFAQYSANSNEATIEGGVSKSMLKKSRLNFDKIEKCK